MISEPTSASLVWGSIYNPDDVTVDISADAPGTLLIPNGLVISVPYLPPRKPTRIKWSSQRQFAPLHSGRRRVPRVTRGSLISERLGSGSADPLLRATICPEAFSSSG
ncbi:hypothetical protein DPEC_G00200940 [Dallia pectoralis]|uniref:Uncharacterized protein n=1 Tax=Dallia pectoralis TaxID=75939 RepID=A0ACC2G8X6_DALPE|nr:hypothetical protein DPEC_G00200940 [Dallia pectoralis]